MSSGASNLFAVTMDSKGGVDTAPEGHESGHWDRMLTAGFIISQRCKGCGAKADSGGDVMAEDGA